MTPLGISSTLLGLLQSGTSAPSTNNQVSQSSDANVDFSSSLSLRLAELQAQSMNSLLGSVLGDRSGTSSLDFLTNSAGLQSGTDSLSGLSASGRQMSLFDPESAYSMMSIINTRDVTYKAQFAELSQMTDAVSTLQQAAKSLGSIDGATDKETVEGQLQAFVSQYNKWVQRFDGTVKSDGLLAGTQAAEVSLYELKQSVENIFNGAGDGFHGMRDLGLVIDQNTHLATLDSTQFDRAMTSNPQGAIDTISEFSGNFSKSAELLVSSNNFLPSRLANLDRVIDYISENKPALQAEFGLGDPAHPSFNVASALIAYNRMVGL